MVAFDSENISQRPTSVARSFHDAYEEAFIITDIVLGSPEVADSQSRVVEFNTDAVNQLFLQEGDEEEIVQRLMNSFDEKYIFNPMHPIEMHDDGRISYNVPISTESIVNSNSEFKGTGPLRDAYDAIRATAQDDEKLFQALKSRVSIDISGETPVINFFIK